MDYVIGILLILGALTAGLVGMWVWLQSKKCTVTISKGDVILKVSTVLPYEGSDSSPNRANFEQSIIKEVMDKFEKNGAMP